MSWLAIDFGTSECSAAFVTNNGKPKQIKFSSPNTVTQFDFPTVAWIQEDGKILVGYEANANASRNLSNYVVEFKLNLEQRSDDNIEGITGFTYTDVSAAILAKIKQEAETERNGNNKFSDVVITVPVDFTKTATKKIIAAAKRAGFSKVELLHEPKAAAIYFNKIAPVVQDKKKYRAFIYDLGGGTFDPAIIQIDNSETGLDFSSPISGEGTREAGKHFDNLMKNAFKVLQPYDNRQVRINRDLKNACKKIKCCLSGEIQATEMVNYGEQGDKIFTLTRSEFNTMIEGAVQESIIRCQELIDANNLKWTDIDVIFFVGGSCNIPYVRETVKAYVHKFNSKTQMVWNEFNGCDLQPQYAVSLGAALYINYLQGSKMNADNYSKSREQLITILNKVLSFQELDDVQRKEFSDTLKRIQEDMFNVVLIGEFQGGKSTTFNTFCDGREISPRGSGIKTSACKITAQNMSDKNIKEYADIRWKTNDEVLQTMSNLTIHGKYELTKKSDCDNVLNLIFKQWEEIPNDEDKKDSLGIALLSIVFFNSKEIQNEFKKNRTDIIDVSNKVTFPIDWNERWLEITSRKYRDYSDLKKQVELKFKPAEVLFLYVAEIRCFIHSPNLGKIGCSISDCPGLFVSSWDTQVANQSMSDSDAVLFLTGGEKEFNKEEKDILKRLLLSKTIFAVNMCKGEERTDSIINSKLSTICTANSKIVKSDIHKYHALLAFCVEFGKQYLKGTIDDFSILQFKRLAGTKRCDKPLERIWGLIVTDCLSKIVDDFDYDDDKVSELNEKSLKKAENYSGADELFGYIKDYIVKSKAESILITNGSGRVRLELQNISNRIATKLQKLSEDKTNALASLAIEEDNFEEFQKFVRNLINKETFPDSMYYSIANVCFDVVFSNEEITGIAKDAAYKITNSTTSFVSQSKFESIAQKEIQDCLKNAVGISSNKWWDDFKISNLRRETIEAEIKKINVQIQEKWKGLLTTNGIMETCPLNSPQGDMWSDSTALNKFDTSKVIVELFQVAISTRFIDGIRAIGNCVGTLGGKVIDAIRGWFGKERTAEAAVKDYFEKLKAEGRFNINTQMIEPICTALRSKILESKNELIQEVIQAIKKMGEDYKSIYIARINDQKKVFDKAITDAKDILESTEAEQKVAIEKEKQFKSKVDELIPIVTQYENLVKKQLKNAKQ